MMMRIFRFSTALFGLLFVLGINGSLVDESLILSGEQRRGQREKVDLPATLGLDQGLIEFEPPEFALMPMRASQPSGEL
jgi:hypothetical protein